MSWKNPASSDDFFLPSTNPYGNYTAVDIIPKNMLQLVDYHWYQFPPINPLWHGLIAVWMVVMGILAVAGNFVVIWVFMNTKSLRTPANLLVVSLAFSDFFMMIFMAPLMVIAAYWETWPFGPLFCQIYGFMGSSLGTISIWNMIWITTDRYNVIVKGMNAEPLTMKGALMRIAFTWTFIWAWCAPPLFGWNRYVPEGNMTACGTDYLTEDMFSHSYLYLYGTVSYIFPLFYNIYCYTFIVSAVAKHEKGMREQAKKMGVKSLRTQEASTTSAECRLAKVALMTVTLWFIAWTPYFTINATGMFAKPYVTPLFSIWGSVFAKANAVYNPLVYAISHPKYRAALEKKLPFLACNNATDTVSETTSAAPPSEEPAESA